MTTSTTTDGGLPLLASTLRARTRQLDDRRRRHSPLRRAYFTLLDVTEPVRALMRGAASARSHGALAQSHGGPSPMVQALEIRSLARRCGIAPEEYYRYRLFAPEQRERATLFIPLLVNMSLRNSVYARLGIDSGVLGDKRRFAEACAKVDLPTASTIAAFDHGEASWIVDRTLPAGDLFEKRADRLCGEGAARWTHLGGGRYRLEDGADRGVELDADALIERLRRASQHGASILQRRLANHPRVAPLSTGGLCTIRIVTHRLREGDPQTLLAVFRMPTGAEPADNFAAGGLASAVDLRRGALGPAVRKPLAEAITGRVHAAHPDTGTGIDGFVLPFWDEAERLCLRAHEAFRAFPSVGWDVALTPDGPVILEGNYNWDVVLAQQPGLRPLGATPLLKSFLSFVD